MNTYRKLLTAAIVIVVFVILTSSATAQGQNNQTTIIVRLTKQAYAQVAGIQTVHTVDYGFFIWLELTPSGFDQLRASGVEFEQQPDPKSLKFRQDTVDSLFQQGAAVDTALDKPSFKVYLPLVFAGSSADVAPDLYIVQLLGPAKDEWLADLRIYGLELLQYFAPYAYLVRMEAQQVTTVEGLDFVRWVGPYLPIYRVSPDLLKRTGVIENVSITIYDNGQKTNSSVELAIKAIEALGGILIEREKARATDPFETTQFILHASAITSVSGLSDVIWLNYRSPTDELEDEMSNQISAGNFNPLASGYQAWLLSKGVNGAGVTVALIDSGYDTGDDATAHPDLQGRLIPVGTPTDTDGHGTHVGGIIAGNASLGTTDANGFLMGLGVAPNANLVVRVNSGDDADRTTDSITNGAVASNNSYALHSASIGYTDRDRTYDLLVRDANPATAAVAESLVIVFSAGNCGNGPLNGSCNGNTGPTKEAKNIIAVGATQNQRDQFGNPGFGNINNVRGSSSRGPAGDGRVYPHLTAPGGNIISTHSSEGSDSCDTIATGAPTDDPTYSMCSGTSMAAPHVTGATALITEWWRDFNAGANPSPAMVKALLVNGAVDMGTADIPNGNEGWGRINLDNVIDSGIPTVYVDQTTIFAATGDTWSARFSPWDPTQPVRVTLTWTDAPGPGDGGNPAALVNDLDLVVDEEGTIYRGNVFANGFSTTGGVADGIDNLENVFIANPTNDAFDVAVTAEGINGDGIPYNGDDTDQDFALVIQNVVEAPTADANGPYETDEGIDVALDGTASSDSDGDPLTYEWDFNYDGVTFDIDATGSNPTFDLVGQDNVYPVALRVINPEGGFDIDQTTVTVNNVAPTVDLSSDAPQDEGSVVTVSGTVTDPGWLDPLTATIDWNDGSPIEPIAGVVENTRPDATLTFGASHVYGDNGNYNVQVCASDDDTTTCQPIAVQIDNVPPTLTIDPAQVTEIDEGEFADVLANFSDPGWLDTYTSSIDWGTPAGDVDAGNLVVTIEGPPLDQGQVTGSHQYGDNGLFQVTVTITDDDGGPGADGFDLTVNNIDPTAEIDESNTILVNGIPTFLAHAGEPLDFSGRSTDPGSDDLDLGWDWDDGAPSPDVTTTYLVNPPDSDPFPSPSVQPRDVTDMQTHAFADACLYEISFLADDDDSGHGEDQAIVIITGNADKARSEGYWQHQYSGNGNIDFDQATLECYLVIVDFMSTVFNEERDASTLERAHDVLFLKQNAGSETEQFDRELLTVWLNFANGALEYTELLDTDKDGVGDTSFGDVVVTAESVRLDSGATDKELREQTSILHRIRQLAD